MRKTFLIIDDDLELLSTYKLLIEENSDCKVLTASNYEKAEELISKQSIDVIFVDYHMPHFDSLKILLKYKEILVMCIITSDHLSTVVRELENTGLEDIKVRSKKNLLEGLLKAVA